MRILVTGGDGQLGCALRLASAESCHHYIFTDITELDITSEVAIEERIARENIDIIINCAAYTAVDLAEDEEVLADSINHKAVATLAEVCKRYNATLIHISTDYIFAGNALVPYTEDAVPAPLNAYGRTKLAGEQAIAKSECRAIVLRTAWLYSEFGRNFCKTMRGLFSSRPEIKLVADQFGTPTYAGDLAKAIVDIIESGQHSKYGIYNYTNQGECSWYEFAVEIAKQSSLVECRINPCSTAEYPTKAIRPRYSVLDKTKFSSTFGMAIPEWQEALSRCINQLNR